MKHSQSVKLTIRNLIFIGAVAAILTLLPGQSIAQPLNAKPAKTETKTWTPPRTSDGHPDLQGVWANNNATLGERLSP